MAQTLPVPTVSLSRRVTPVWKGLVAAAAAVLAGCASSGGSAPDASEHRELQSASAEANTAEQAVAILEQRLQQRCFGKPVEIVSSDLVSLAPYPTGFRPLAGDSLTRLPGGGWSGLPEAGLPDAGTLGGALAPAGTRLPGGSLAVPRSVWPSELGRYRAEALFRCGVDS